MTTASIRRVRTIRAAAREGKGQPADLGIGQQQVRNHRLQRIRLAGTAGSLRRGDGPAVVSAIPCKQLLDALAQGKRQVERPGAVHPDVRRNLCQQGFVADHGGRVARGENIHGQTALRQIFCQAQRPHHTDSTGGRKRKGDQQNVQAEAPISGIPGAAVRRSIAQNISYAVVQCSSSPRSAAAR